MQTSELLFLMVSILIYLTLLMRLLIMCQYHRLILIAIHDYRIDCIRNRQVSLVEYDDIESLVKTFIRFSDWGYTRILPTDKFTIVKPYIKRLKDKRRKQ